MRKHTGYLVMGYLDNQFWKPDENDMKVVSIKKKESSKAKRRRKAREKKKRLASSNDNRKVARLGLIKHFGLHKYATNIAICLCIHNECGIELPDSDRLAHKMISDYWKNKTGKTTHKRHNYMTSDDFYSSKKWREVRFIALQQSEGRCTLCGASAKDGVQLHVDHIKPRSRFPELQFDLDNLQILCQDCNLGKSNYDDTDFR